MAKKTTPAADTAKHASALRDEEALEHLMAELPSGAQYVLVQRQNDQDPSRWDRLPRIAAADFSVETVIEMYGGGKYRVQVVGESGKLMSTKWEFAVDPRLKPTKGPLVEQAVQVGTMPGVVAGSSRLEKLMEFQLMLSMRESGKGGGTGSFKEMIEVVNLLLDKKAPAPTGKDPMEMFFRGADFMKEFAEKGGDKDPLAELAHSAGPLFEAMAENVLADAATKRQRRQLRAGATTPPAAGESPVAQTDWKKLVRAQLPRLIKLAQGDKDPSLYADVIVDQLGDDVLGQVYAAAKDPEFVTKTLAEFPEVEPYAAWFTELLQGVKEGVMALGAEPAPASP